MSGHRSTSTKSFSTEKRKISLCKTSPTNLITSYWVEFSKPKQEKPIPEGTVKVDFFVNQIPDSDDYYVEFKFENESLLHNLEKTMRKNMFQVTTIKN